MEIKTKADVKRLPPGTRLRCVRNLRGEVSAAEGGRVVQGVRGNGLIVVIDAPGIYLHGKESVIVLDKHTSVEPRDNGFAVLTSTQGPGSPQVVGVEYVFEESL